MPVIPAQPYDFDFDPSGLVLFAIDMQRDYLEEGGYGSSLGLDPGPSRAIIPAMAALIAAFRDHRLPVIHTKQCHKPDLSDLPPAKHRRGRQKLKIGDEGPMGRLLICGEPGSDIVPELAPADGEIVIEKPGKGSFYNTSLQADLDRLGATHLVFTGVTTEVCVQTTIREANDRGYDCLLVEDATESYYPEFKQATIEMVRSSDALIGWTSTSDKVLSALAGL
ncbi:MAG: cysteine hydrolase [Alphaproteobacteria bacterium]|nr:cysteine hydrolase [Alphaproteobacteria bacterium]